VNANPGQEQYWRQAGGEYGAALERRAWAYEADPERRRDLLQEIHLALWRSFATFDARCGPGSIGLRITLRHLTSRGREGTRPSL
jgi:RNA polymerase sigma-70 factor, ECF subfamily